MGWAEGCSGVPLGSLSQAPACGRRVGFWLQCHARTPGGSRRPAFRLRACGLAAPGLSPLMPQQIPKPCLGHGGKEGIGIPSAEPLPCVACGALGRTGQG